MTHLLDIDWHGRMSSNTTFRTAVLQARVARVAIQLFPRADAGLNDWRLFIFVQSPKSELVLELGFNTTLIGKMLTCTLLKQSTLNHAGTDPRLVAESRPGYTPPTVQRVLEIGTAFGKLLFLAPELSAREIQSRWSSWTLQFVMELVENVPLFVSSSDLHRFTGKIDWNKGDE